MVRLRRRRAGQREKERRWRARGRCGEMTQRRGLKGTGSSRDGRRKRVPEARADLACRARGRAGGARGPSGLGAPSAGGSRGPAGGFQSLHGGRRSGCRDGRGQRRVRPQHAGRRPPVRRARSGRVPLRDAHLVLDGEIRCKEHPGGRQPVHQVRRGAGRGRAAPGPGAGEPGGARSPGPQSPPAAGSQWSALGSACFPGDAPVAGPHPRPGQKPRPAPPEDLEPQSPRPCRPSLLGVLPPAPRLPMCRGRTQAATARRAGRRRGEPPPLHRGPAPADPRLRLTPARSPRIDARWAGPRAANAARERSSTEKLNARLLGCEGKSIGCFFRMDGPTRPPTPNLPPPPLPPLQARSSQKWLCHPCGSSV